MTFREGQWAVILGGSSGFGLATAQKLAEHGMHCFLLHRDRRGAMARIEPEFERIRQTGVSLVTLNVDALDPAVRADALARLAEAMGPSGRVRVLLHSIAIGNLKPLLPGPERGAVLTTAPSASPATGAESVPSYSLRVRKRTGVPGARSEGA